MLPSLEITMVDTRLNLSKLNFVKDITLIYLAFLMFVSISADKLANLLYHSRGMG